MFQGFQFKDSTSIIIQAKKENVKKRAKTDAPEHFNRDFFIEIDSFSHPRITRKPPSSGLGFEELDLE